MSVATKKEFIKRKIENEHGCVGKPCARCSRIHRLIDKMQESNIPVGYWFLTMKDFNGPEKLAKIVNEYTLNIEKMYLDGGSACFAGNQGTGKTMSSICILKSALKKNLSAFYITASDILNEMTDIRHRNELRATLRNCDFLVIDELDSRFFVSDSTKELFSGIYENIFRFRTHNTLPTIICTNETNGLLDVFYGQSKHAIDSLNKQYLKVYPVVGKDYRKGIGNNGS